MMEVETRGPKICLHGNYHTDNFGDILLMGLFAKWIREYSPLSTLSLPFASEEIRALTRASGGVGYRALLAADALVYGGGGYFGEPGGSQVRWGNRLLARHIPPGEILRVRGRPYAVLGVGVGPLTHRIARKAVVRLCRGAGVLAVRDEESREYLLEYGMSAEQILVTADAAMALRLEDLPSESRAEAREALADFPFPLKVGVHVSFPSRHGPASARLIEEICSSIRANVDAGCVLLVDQAGVNPQVHAAREIMEKLPGKNILLSYRGPWFLSAILAELDLVITTKLHVGIVGTAFDKQVLSFPTHGKTPRFYRQTGSVNRCRPLLSLKNGEASAMIQSAMHQPPVHDPLRDAVKREAGRNRRYVKEFVERLNRGS